MKRFDVMYNDFVIVGPKSDPAGVAGGPTSPAALQKIAAARRPSPRAATTAAPTRPSSSCGRPPASTPRAASGTWYRETGSGMGPTLNTAAGMGAYALTDRGTWLSFQNRGDLEILVEGDAKLFNQYGVILVNPDKHPNVKAELGQQFVDWLIGPEGQQAIAELQDRRRAAVHPEPQEPQDLGPRWGPPVPPRVLRPPPSHRSPPMRALALIVAAPLLGLGAAPRRGRSAWSPTPRAARSSSPTGSSASSPPARPPRCWSMS